MSACPRLKRARPATVLAALCALLAATPGSAADDATLAPAPDSRTVGQGAADSDGRAAAFREIEGGALNRFNSALPVAAEEGLWHQATGLLPDSRIRLHLSSATAPADGHARIELSIRLLDAAGEPLRTPARIKIETSLGRLEAPNGQQAESFEVAVPAGEAQLVLLAPVVPGDALLRVSSGAVGVEGRLSFLPELRPLMAIGIIETGLSSQHLSSDPNAPAIARTGFEDSLQHWGNSRGEDGTSWSTGGRAAAFVKGTIADNLLLTASYDSNKINPQRFFSDIDPNLYFPISGDASIINYDARSTSKLYARLDEGKSHLLYGDFQTVSPGETAWLGSYARTLTGATAHYESPLARANVFAALESAHQFVDEQPGRGISGPYAVSQANAIANSEIVELLVRDRNQPAIVLSRQVLARFADYDFEPFSGRIVFRRPVPSADENLNPVSIRITYEVDDGGPRYWVDGANGEIRAARWLTLGGRYAEDRDPMTPYRVYGADSVMKLGTGTTLTVDLARSEGSQLYSSNGAGSLVAASPLQGLLSADPTGDAGRIELVHRDVALDARLYAAKADLGFENANAGLSPGRSEAGGHATYRLSTSMQVVVDALRSEDATTDAHRSAASASLEAKLWPGVKLEGGLSFVNQTYNPALSAVAQYGVGAVPGGAGSSAATTGFGFAGTGLLGSPLTGAYSLPMSGAALVEQNYTSARLRLSDRLTDRAGIYGEYEHTIDGTSGERAAIGGEYRVGDSGRIYVRHEVIDSLTGIYGLGGGSRATQTVLGVDSSYMRDGTVYSEYRLAGTESGQSVANALGLRNLWRLGGGLNASTSLERQQVEGAPPVGGTPLGSIGTQPATAVALGLDYTGSPLWKGAGRIEYRFSDVQTNWLSTLAATRKLSDDWSLIGRNVYLSSHAAGAEAAGGHQDEDRLQLGVAYLDIASNTLNALARYEYRTDINTALADPTDGHTQILAVIANYQPLRAWTFEGQLAGKDVRETLDGTPSNFSAVLLAGRAMWDFNPRWDAAILASSTTGGGTADRGIALEAGYRVIDDLWVSAGCIAGRYADTELFSANSSWQGVYVRMRFKFDERSFRAAEPQVNRSLDAAATAVRQ